MEKAKQFFKEGKYREVANALAVAEMVARDDPDQLARIKLLLFYAHIGTGEDAQAVVDVIWLSMPDLLTGQPRGLRALKNPGEVVALYGRRIDFDSQQARLRLLSVSRYDYLALNAMMAWASGDSAEARRLAKESNVQFVRFLDTQKIDLADLGSPTGGSAVERSFRAAVVWPKHFEVLVTRAATEAPGGAPTTAPAGR